jgi:hypothetical protein
MKSSSLIPLAFLVAVSFCAGTSCGQDTGSPPAAQAVSAERTVYDNDELFQQLSGAARTRAELKFGRKVSGGVKPVVGDPAAGRPTPGPRSLLANALVNNPTTDTTSQDTQSETSLALAGGNLVSVFNDSGSFNPSLTNYYFTGCAQSGNGGLNWADRGHLPNSYPPNGDLGDPVLAYSKLTGTLLLSTLSYNASYNLLIFRSTDYGVTFSAPVNGAPGFNATTGNQDKEWITCDNFPGTGYGTFYMFWRNFGTGGGMTLTKSTDDGLTWGPSGGTVLLSGSGQGGQVVVGPDHSVYCFWYDSTTSPRRIVMRKSTNLGVTFGSTITVASLIGTGSNGDLGLGGFRSSSFCQVVINPVSGNIYVIYPDVTAVSGGDRGNIYFQQSTNGGATWSAAYKVNDDSTTRAQFQPTIAARPDGTGLAVCWYDRRNDPADALIEYWGVTATVSGATVTWNRNFRISQPFPAVYGVDPVLNPTYMGDYDQMAADNNYFYVTWADNCDNSLAVPSRKNANVRFARFTMSGPGPVLGRGAITLTGGNGDQLVNPNECLTMNVAVNNSGNAPASSVLATLSSSTPGVTVIQGVSAYPDLDIGATGTNLTPFRIQTAPGVACGTPINLSMAISYAGGSDTSTLSLPVAAPSYTITQTTGATIVPGVADTGNHYDDGTTVINLPFAYNMYGQNYLTAALSSNGNLQFGGNNIAYVNGCLPAAGFADTIFAHWDDLRTDGVAHGIYISTNGVAPNRIFNIEWRAQYLSPSNNLNFEVRLYEGQTRFDIIYGAVPNTGASATVGVQHDAATATSFECNAGGLSAGLQLTFRMQTCADGGGPCEPCGLPVAINFENAPTAAMFVNTQRLTNQYAGVGVVFQGPGGLDGGAVVNTNGGWPLTGYSGSNFLAFNTNATLNGGGVPRGPETLLFSPPVSSVTLRAATPDAGSFTLSAYNALNALLSTSTINLSSALAPVQVSGDSISRVVISSPAATFVVDDLTLVPICDCTLQAAYPAAQSFADGLGSATMGMAFDGTNYWSVSGNSTSGNRLARYSSTGTLLATYAPGLDFRSIFTDAAGNVFARPFSSSVIYRMTSLGVFSPYLTLSGGSLDPQSSVVINGTTTDFIAMSGGTVSRWSSAGAYLGTTTLAGFGSVTGENVYPSSRGIAALGGYWLTYNNANRTVSFWNNAGTRVTQSALVGAGTGFDSAFSFSYCNGQAFAVDVAGSAWRGYQICAQGNVDGITTTLTNGNGFAGSMFDLQPKTAFQINALDLNITATNPLAVVTVYYRDGTSFGQENTNAGWNLLGIRSVPAAGANLPTHVNLAGNGIVFFPGHTYGLYVYVDYSAGSGMKYSNGSNTFENADLRLISNCGKGDPPFTGSTFSQRIWNGTIYYETVPGAAVPSIIAQPANQTVPAGMTAAFNVTAAGAAPLSYFWQRNGSIIPGATTSSYATNNVQLADSGALFSCLVSNAYGTAQSASALLTVPPPAYTVLARGNLAVTLDDGAARVYSLRFQGNEIYRVGFFLSDWGLQAGTNAATFVRNENNSGTTSQPMTLLSASPTSAAYRGTYTAGGAANVTVNRIYSLLYGCDVLRTVQTFVNNGTSNLTLRCFDTFDPDWNLNGTNYYYMFADRYSLGTNGVAVQMGRGIMTNGPLVVILGTTDASALLAASYLGYFGIESSADLNTFFAMGGADSNGGIVDASLDIGREMVLGPGASASFIYYHSLATNVARAEGGIVVYAIALMLEPRWVAPNLCQLTFATVPGHSYVVEYRNSLTSGTWTPMQTNVGDGNLQTVVNTVTSAPQRFFRLRLQ